MRSSGVALLDELLGELTPGFPLVLTGPTGAGRTVLCLQLAWQATHRGERAAFLTGEPARLLLRQAASLELDLAEPLREGQLVLLELDAEVAATARVHGGQALVEAIGQAVPDASLLVVDPLTSLSAEVVDEAALRALVRTLFDGAAAAEQIVVVTAETDSLAANPALERVLKEACGAFVELDNASEGAYIARVAKSRAAGGTSGSLSFRIGAGGTRLAPSADAGGTNAAPGEGRGAPALRAPIDVLGRARVKWSDVAGDDSAGDPGGEERAPTKPPEAPSEPDVARTPAPTPTSAPAEPQAGSRAKVLIVDDDRMIREQLRDWLAEFYEVETAEDGFQGVAAVLQKRPDLVLLDLVMPRVDGFEVLKTLRAGGARLPVLVLSSNLSRATDRVRVLVVGATDLMPKPVQRFELLRKVETLLSQRDASPPGVELGRLEVADLETLFEGDRALHALEEAPFRERVERACRFGQQFGLPSALVGVEASSADALDRCVAGAEKTLRAEDAIFALSKRRAVLLLVSTQVEFVPKVLSRLGVERGKASLGRGLRWWARAAEPWESAKAWDPLFEDLAPWPASGG